MPTPGFSLPSTAPRPELLDLAALKLARSSLEALALKPGQLLEAKVMGTAPNGLTQLAIAGQLLNVKLPLTLPPGTQLQLEVRPGPPQGLPVLAVQLPQAAASLRPAPPLPAPMPMPVAAPRPMPVAPLSPAPVAATPVIGPAPQPVLVSVPVLPQAPATPVAATMVAVPAGTGANPAPNLLPAGATPLPLPAAAAPLPVAAGPTPAPAPMQAPPVPAAAPSNPVSPAPLPPRPATVSGTTAATAAPVLPSVPVNAAPRPAAMPPQAAHGQAAPNVGANGGPTLPVATSVIAPNAHGVQPPPAAAASPPALAARPAIGGTTTASTAPAPVGVAKPPLAPGGPRTFQAVPSAPPAAGSSAQVTLGQATQAAARQDSMAPLLQNLSALQARSGEFPRPVMEAAMRLLGARIVLDRGAPGGEALKQAVLRSGIFLEAMARPQAGKALPQGDIKAALLQLRGALTAWLGGEVAPVPPVTRRPEPPLRGAQPRGHRADAPTLASTAAPKEAGHTLLSQTEAALSRTRLLQLASLPPETARAGATANAAAAAADWTLELPLLLGHELAMAQLQISRDAKSKGGKRERGWRLGFSLNFSALGEVGAQVSLFGRSTSVAVWADEEETAAALAEMLPELTAALTAKGLDVGSVRVRTGRPPAPRPVSGQLLDSVR